MHPLALLHPSSVHGLLSLHWAGAPLQLPVPQTSPTVHALPSLHTVPLSACWPIHAPELGAHTVFMQVVSPLLSQFIMVAGLVTQVWVLSSQNCMPLQRFPSSWQSLSTTQSHTESPGWHVPPPHLSWPVQGFPSLHETSDPALL